MRDKHIQIKLRHIPLLTEHVLGNQKFIIPGRKKIRDTACKREYKWHKMKPVFLVHIRVIAQHTPYIKKGQRPNQVKNKFIGKGKKGHYV